MMSVINKFKSYYTSISLPAKASMWFVVCSLIQKGISFFTTPLFTRMLSTENYGVIVLYNSWIEIITIFATFQLATGVFNKAMMKYADDRDGYTSSSLILASIITSLFFLVYLIGHKCFDVLLDMPMHISVMMFIEIFFSTSISFFSVRNRFEFKYKSVVIVTLFIALLGPLTSIFLIMNSSAEYHAEAKIQGLLLIKIIVGLVIFIYIIRKGKKVFVISYWKYSLEYNLPLIPHYLSQQVLTQSDRIMINSMCGKTDAAIYGVAYQLAMVAFLFTYAIHSSLGPWVFQSIENRNYGSIAKRALFIELSIGILCFTFSLFAPELILILGGSTYSEAVWIVPPVAMSVLFQTIYTMYGYIEFYYEKTRFVMIASMVCAVANLALNYIFIPIFGFVAAGYTTLFCYVLYAVVHFVFSKKIIDSEHLDGIFKNKHMWFLSIIFIAGSLFVSLLYKYIIARYVCIFIVVLVMVVIIKKYKNELVKLIR